MGERYVLRELLEGFVVLPESAEAGDDSLSSRAVVHGSIEPRANGWETEIFFDQSKTTEKLGRRYERREGAMDALHIYFTEVYAREERITLIDKTPRAGNGLENKAQKPAEEPVSKATLGTFDDSIESYYGT